MQGLSKKNDDTTSLIMPARTINSEAKFRNGYIKP